MEARDVVGEGAAGDGVAQFAHQLLVVVQVVDGGEAGTKDLVEPVEVVQVAPREVAAGVAVAGLVDGSGVLLVHGVADLHVAVTGKRAKIAEIFPDETGDRWYTCKINIILLDEGKGIEKKVANFILVQALAVNDAWNKLMEGMKGTLSDFVVISIAESPILDIFPYKNDDMITKEINQNSI